MTKNYRISPSVTEACSDSDSGTDYDNNGNKCSDYANLVTCTDCLCDVADDTMNFISGDQCCACGGGTKPTICAKTEALEILNIDTNIWVDYDQTGGATDNTSDYPWINAVSWGSSSYADSKGSVTVLPLDGSDIPTGDTEVTKYLRWKVSDARSSETEGTLYN